MQICRSAARVRALSPLVGLLMSFSLAGCLATPEDLEAAEEEISLGETAQALDDYTPDANDGKTCYLNGPMKKGTMDGGWCCYDIPNGQACRKCNAANDCEIGGGSGTVVSIQVTTTTATGGVRTPRSVTKAATKAAYQLPLGE